MDGQKLGLWAAVVCSFTLSTAFAWQDEAQPQTLASVEFRDASVSDAMYLLSLETGLKLVPTVQASQVKINSYLQDVAPMEALDAVARTNDLQYWVDPKSQVILIYTSDEQRRDLVSLTDEAAEFRNVTLFDALRFLSVDTGLKLVASEEAAATRVSLYLRDAEPMETIVALALAHGLRYDVDPDTDVIYLSKKDEPQPGLVRITDDGYEFRDVLLADALRAMSRHSGLNIVPSQKTSDIRVSLFLRNVQPMDALSALTKAYGLWYRVDPDSGVIQVYTTDEYQRDLASFRDERTEVYTLLYPNAHDIASVIRDVFGERVRLSLGSDDQATFQDLAERLDRFDLIDGRSQGLGLFGGAGGFGGGGFGGGGFGFGGFGRGGMGGMGGFGRGGMGMGRGGMGTGGTFGRRRSDLLRDSRAARQSMSRPGVETLPPELLEDLTPEEIQRLEAALTDPDPAAEDREFVAQLLTARRTTIFVSVIGRHNQLIVRTGDETALEEIRMLIAQLDVPTPMVLLEVKLLAVELGDDFQSVFDYQFFDGSTSAGNFTSGNIIPGDSDLGNIIPGIPNPLVTGFAGVIAGAPGDLLFQYVSESFRFRMQMLESKNRVTTLATPILLTANNEVSRLFVGEEVPVNRSFTGPQPITDVGAVVSTQFAAGSTGIEFRPVGTTLLITPNVNADRTVTLRVLQENSNINPDGAEILIPTNDGFERQSVDTVQSRTVSGTIVAKDGHTVAIGGLIEEGVRDARQQIPVLGKLPGIGFLFRRQLTERFRKELVIMVRPFVLTTPVDGQCISQELLEQLSLHPNAPHGTGSLNSHTPIEVLRPRPPLNRKEQIFRTHNITPKSY